MSTFLRQVQCRRLSAIGLGVADIVGSIRLGSLKVVSGTTDGAGYTRCLFQKADVDHLINVRTKGPKGWLTIPMAAKQMYLKQQVVYELVRQGHLPSKQMSVRGQPVRMIAKQAISDFQKVYVTARTLAKKIGTSPKHLIRLLEEKGLVPDIGPRIDGNRQTFYRRSKLPRNIIGLKPIRH